MTDPTTTRIALPYPVGSDSVSSGPAEMQAIDAIVDALWGLDFTDFLKPGVTGSVVGQNASGPTVNSSTGVLTFSLNADHAWILASSILTRTAVPTGSVVLTPSALPTSGNFRCVGLYIAPGATWGSSGTLSIVVGTSQTSQALALANPPSTPAGTLLMQYVVLTNSSGTYSISTTVDERTTILGLSGPTGTAGGSLTGSYPNPTLAAGAAAANLGPAAGNLNGSFWPNVIIALGSINASMLQSGVAASNVGSLGGDLSGSLPTPSIGSGKVTNSKIASSVPLLDLSGLGVSGARASMQLYTSVPTCGPGSSPFAYDENGVSFSNACVAAGQCGAINFSDSGHSSPATMSDMSWSVAPNGQHPRITFLNLNGANRFPQFAIWAIGY